MCFVKAGSDMSKFLANWPMLLGDFLARPSVLITAHLIG
jgi:hypothetical protein